MTAYSLAVQADVRKRMSPPNRQDVPQISKELGIHQSTLYQWRSNWQLPHQQGKLPELNGVITDIPGPWPAGRWLKPAPPRSL